MQAKSIYRQFHQKLVIATSLFITVISFIFYGFTKSTIFDELQESLYADAELILKISQRTDLTSENFNVITHGGTNIDIVTLDDIPAVAYTTYKTKNNNYMEILYPFDTSYNFV